MYREHYRGMLIKEDKTPVWFLGRNAKLKKGYDKIFKVFEMGNLVGSANNVNDAKAIVDKVREEEE